MKYKVLRTDTADSLIRNIILYVAERFGNDVALEKLNALETSILALADNPYIGTDPRYTVLKRQGYKVLITEKDLVFYKINEESYDLCSIRSAAGLSEYYQRFMKSVLQLRN